MSDLDHRNVRKPWTLTVVGLCAAVGLILMPFLAGTPNPDQAPEIIRFLGRFHPVLLHLPIGVFTLILLQELGTLFRKKHAEFSTHRELFPLGFGAASAVVAVLAGFFLYQGDDGFAGNALVERHLWGGIAFSALAIGSFILKAWTVVGVCRPVVYRLLLLVSIGTMGFASHDGASVTHGENYLTEFAPNPVRGMLGIEKKAVKKIPQGKVSASSIAFSPVVYADLVAPIFERRCTECHKESKAKGKLKMDSYEMLLKGGKEGPGIEPGNSSKSNIVIRMKLPQDDDDVMPPEGKTPLEAAEMAVVQWWIDNGADPQKSLADYQVPDEIQRAIAQLPAKSTTHAEKPSSSAHAASPPERSEALISAVAAVSQTYPGTLNFESPQSSLLSFSAIPLRGNLDDVGFKKLAPVIPSLVSVDLSATRVTDQSVALLVPAGSLKLLRLVETGITDAAVDSLLRLPSLESINLYGCKVTDQGIAKLSAMPNLKRLYLWKTAVTPEVIVRLKEKLPQCEIITTAEP